jgi:hypothetical protein
MALDLTQAKAALATLVSGSYTEDRATTFGPSLPDPNKTRHLQILTTNCTVTFRRKDHGFCKRVHPR